MTQKTVNRLTFAVAVVMFFAAIFVLYRELENTRLVDVIANFEALPKTRVMLALALTAASYLLLTGYDFLALSYANHRLRPRETLFASFISFSFSNNLGFALMSGGSVRYWIYTAFGLRPVEVGEVVAFCTLTYGLGVATVGGLMLLFDPTGMSSILNLPQRLVLAIGIAMLAMGVAYLVVILAGRGPIALWHYQLRLPSLGCGLMQFFVASLDQALAAGVVYVLLPPDTQISFLQFLGVYVIAAPISLLSLVPGGLGVFETMVVALVASPSKAALLGSLIAYRLIYFVLPLVLAIFLVAIYEMSRSSRGSDWHRRLLSVLTRNAKRDPGHRPR
jgi:uncharacterized membrane protein YbhN (UPF0104 family)